MREPCERLQPSVVLIEDKASGTQLNQERIAEDLYAVTRYQPQSDKVMRMHAQTAMIENGFVHPPDARPWLAQYLHELTTFPDGRHDDQVDSTAQMLDWFKRSDGPTTNRGSSSFTGSSPSKLAANGPRRAARYACAPLGVGVVQLLSGIHRAVAADGTVEMSESDAAPLLGAGWVKVDAHDLTN